MLNISKTTCINDRYCQLTGNQTLLLPMARDAFQGHLYCVYVDVNTFVTYRFLTLKQTGKSTQKSANALLINQDLPVMTQLCKWQLEG